MGRTLPTIVQCIRFEEEQWNAYRRALRQEDREHFDALWRYVRHFAVSSQMANRPIPFEVLLFSMILGVIKEVHQLQKTRPVEAKEGSLENDHGLDF